MNGTSFQLVIDCPCCQGRVVVSLITTLQVAEFDLHLNGQLVEAIEESHLIGDVQRAAIGASAGVGTLGLAGRRPIAAAISRRAEE